MAYTIVNAMLPVSANVDAYNLTGKINADIENGTIVTRGAMLADTTTKIVTGYEFAIAKANASTAGDAYIVCTPEIGIGVDNIYHDPRKFINKANQPVAIKKLVKDEFWEVSKDAFGSADDYPTTSEIGYYIPVDANGKLGTPQQAALTNKVAFKVEALSKMAVGQELVDGVILSVANN